MASTWIDTITARRAAASEPKTPEQLNPGPALQPPLGQVADVMGMVRDEVSKQMDSFTSRLEALFAPKADTVQPADAPAGAPSSPVTPPETVPAVENPPAAPAAAESAFQPA